MSADSLDVGGPLDIVPVWCALATDRLVCLAVGSDPASGAVSTLSLFDRVRFGLTSLVELDCSALRFRETAWSTGDVAVSEPGLFRIVRASTEAGTLSFESVAASLAADERVILSDISEWTFYTA